LQVFGGSPAFAEKLHVGRPNIGNRERFLDRVRDMLDRRWLSNGGPYVKEFERRVAEYLGVRHCIAVCNGTIALEILERALGLTGEVIVPAFTAAATPHSLEWQHITPVFCDILPDTHCINPDRVEELITPKTTGILGVHLWGRACEVERLQRIAERHQLKLLFDASHALGCTLGGKMIGHFGAAEVLSFHATKFLQSFEGGAVVTNDDALAARVRSMVFYGFRGEENVISIGTNGKMSEVCAAMGLTSLESIDEIIAAHRRNYLAYRHQLSGIRGLRLFEHDLNEQGNYQYIVLEIDGETAGISREAVMTVLRGENVLVRRHFCPGCHNMEPYRTRFPELARRLPVTEQVVRRLVTLPSGTAVSEKDVNRICEIIRLAVLHADEVNRLIRDRSVTTVAPLLP
jgi:dTDP-4-amino-4,6-dideoxygalactose transaminase